MAKTMNIGNSSNIVDVTLSRMLSNNQYKEIYVGTYYNNDVLGTTTSSSNSDTVKAIIKQLCIDYPNQTSVKFKGRFGQNSQGFYEIVIYNTDAKDATSGLPQYSYGFISKYFNVFAIVYTQEYVYSYKEGACSPLSEADINSACS